MIPVTMRICYKKWLKSECKYNQNPSRYFCYIADGSIRHGENWQHSIADDQSDLRGRNQQFSIKKFSITPIISLS